ncbi:hypothetical protein HYH03_001770 [Edaphochlamys debaryana]|uniref:Uncharacterized protein n=1 Tax=Edaphochlamys debaryana TaxID=47281 RepID=A0A835YC31_9CHLO|nr:hypothetical protein HYH03_001770 [Edaphochlamys debaryana]|eukprot:KAG2500190.1 hypothetical protein HYH03_001770 [Edaphochlamys debaryana]
MEQPSSRHAAGRPESKEPPSDDFTDPNFEPVTGPTTPVIVNGQECFACLGCSACFEWEIKRGGEPVAWFDDGANCASAQGMMQQLIGNMRLNNRVAEGFESFECSGNKIRTCGTTSSPVTDGLLKADSLFGGDFVNFAGWVPFMTSFGASVPDLCSSPLLSAGDTITIKSDNMGCVKVDQFYTISC